MKKILKWVGIILGSLLGLLVIAIGFLYVKGNGAATELHTVPNDLLLTSITSDSAAVARGEHLVNIHACNDCHGENLGGKVFIDAPPFMRVAPNLTSGRGGIGSTYSVADWDRAVRYGVRPDGSALFPMPSAAYHNMSDKDFSDIIAYVQSVPSVDNELPSSEYRLLGKIIIGTGGLDPAMEVATERARETAPPPGATGEYGQYLLNITCQYCHGADFQGGPSPEPDILSPSLAAAAGWTTDIFINTIRTGKRPDGTELDPVVMPWPSFSKMTDAELQAIHTHLNSIFN